jgi:predicted nuclease of predicted toxin-antitoxin system
VRLPEPYILFVDRSLGGRVVADALRGAGEDVRAHDDLFAQDTDDEVWLAEMGKRGWVVLTKDALIRRDSLQRRALLSANVAAFVLARGDVSGAVMAALRRGPAEDEEGPSAVRRPLHRLGDCQRGRCPDV